MLFKLQPPGGERTWYAVTCLGLGTYFAVKWFARADISGGVFGVLLVLAGAGLWFNQQWARWSGIALVTFSVGYIAYKMSHNGWGVLGLAGMAAGSWGAWGIGRNLLRPKSPKRNPLPAP